MNNDVFSRPADITSLERAGLTISRKFIRSGLTRAFLTPDYGWTKDPDKALSFADMNQVLELSKSLRLQDAEVYYCFAKRGLSQFDFSLRL